MAVENLTAQRLRELLHYAPETGVFTWIVCRVGTGGPGSVAGGINALGRWTMAVGGKRYLRYRLAWLYMTGEWPRYEIDHINGLQADDRFCNLRDVTRRLNQQNQRTATKTKLYGGLLGAFWSKREKRWKAGIGHRGRTIWLGTYQTAEAAHAAYIEAKRRLHPGCTI